MTLALFDLDGTLLDGYTWKAIYNHHVKNKVNRHILYAFLGSHYPLYPLMKLGLVSREKFYEAWGANMSWVIRGIGEKRADSMWDWIIKHEFIPKIRPEMHEALNFHKRAQHKIVFISGTFQPLLDRLADEFGADAALATGLETRNGVYTGRIIRPLNIGSAKMDQISGFLANLENKFDLGDAYMYSDSIVDLPVMEAVGNPVAVYPEIPLMEVAVRNGWKVIGEVGY